MVVRFSLKRRYWRKYLHLGSTVINSECIVGNLYILSAHVTVTRHCIFAQESERNRERAPSGWRQGVKAGHRLSHRLETHLQSAFLATHLAVSHISINTAGVTFRCGKVKLGVLQIVPAGKQWNNRDLELNKQKTVWSTVTDTNLVEELDRSSYWTRFSEVVEPFKWQFSVPWKQSPCLVRSRANTSFFLARLLTNVLARTTGFWLKILKLHITI